MSHKNAGDDHSAYRLTFPPEELEGAERHTLTPKEHAQIQRCIRFHWLYSLADKLQAALAKPMRDVESRLQESADRIEQLESLSPDRADSNEE